MLREIVVIFSNVLGEYGVCCFAIIGFIFVDSKKFVYCIYLMMTTMIYNTILKNIFQLPLPETCPSDNFGFPSGHSHFASVFYIWCIIHYRNSLIRAACSIAIILQWYALVYLGFHYFVDTWAATLFGVGSVVLYKFFVIKSGHFHKISLFTIILSILWVSETQTILYPRIAMIPIAIKVVLYAILAWFFVFKRESLPHKTQIFLYTILYGTIIYALLFHKQILNLPPHIYIALYSILGLYLGEIFSTTKSLFNSKPNTTGLFSLLIGCFLLFTTTSMRLECQALNQIGWFCFAFAGSFFVRSSNDSFTKQ
jgi:xanthosine utilization system XapX-like protein